MEKCFFLMFNTVVINTEKSLKQLLKGKELVYPPNKIKGMPL